MKTTEPLNRGGRDEGWELVLAHRRSDERKNKNKNKKIIVSDRTPRTTSHPRQ